MKCDVLIITAIKRGQDVTAIRRRCGDPAKTVTVRGMERTDVEAGRDGSR